MKDTKPKQSKDKEQKDDDDQQNDNHDEKKSESSKQKQQDDSFQKETTSPITITTDKSKTEESIETETTNPKLTNDENKEQQMKETEKSGLTLRALSATINKLATNDLPSTLNSSEIKLATFSPYSGYEALRNLKTESPDVSPQYKTMLTTEKQHFLRPFISNDAGSPTHIQNEMVSTIEDNLPIMTQSREVFSKGIKLCLLGIDCRREGAEFYLNPFEPELIQLKSANDSDLLALKQAIHMCTFSLHGDESLIQYLVVAAYATRVAGFIGNFRYIMSKNIPDRYNDLASAQLAMNSQPHTISLNSVYVDPNSTDFYYGRLPSDSVNIELLKGISNLPNDNYKDYFRPEIAQRYLPTTWSRTAASVYGRLKLSSTESRNVHEGTKLSEIAEIGTDVVMAELQANALDYLDTLKIDRRYVIELVNGMFLNRTEITSDVHNDLPFYNAVTVFQSALSENLDYTTFPISDIHKHAFQVVPNISQSCLIRTFNFLVESANEHFNAFPMLSTDNIYTGLISTESSAVNSYLPSRVSQLLNSLSSYAVNNETLSFKMALDLLSPYNLVESMLGEQSTPSPDTLPFVSEYFGMIVSKYMYYNTWMRNQYAWYSHVRNFFLKWFNRSRLISQYETNVGFGFSYTNEKYRSKLTRQHDHITIYNYSSNGPAFVGQAQITALMSDVRNAFCLTKNNVAVTHTTNFGEYGIRDRTFRVPGVCRAPVIGTNTEVLPMETELKTFESIVARYDKYLEYSRAKLGQSAIDSTIYNVDSIIPRFSQFFHCAYCPIYLALAKSPLLLHDDTNIDHKSWYGMIDTDPQSAQRGVVPSFFRYNAIQPFGSPQLPEAINLLFSACVPGTFATRGYNYTATTDFRVYGSLYTPNYVIKSFEFYKQELMRRHQMFEAVNLTSSLADGTLLEGMPEVAAAINTYYNLLSVPLISWIYLGKVLINNLAGEDSEVKKYVTDYLSLMLPELRLRKPSFTIINSEGDRTDYPFMSTIRPVVIKNVKLILDYLFGLHSLRPLNRGVTFSHQALPAPLLFRTSHFDAPIQIDVSNDVYVNIMTEFNTAHLLLVTCSDAAATLAFRVSPTDTSELLNAIHNSGFFPTTRPPYFKLIINSRRNQYSKTAIEYYYKLYQQGHLIVHLTYLYHYQSYSLKTPLEATETAPITYEKFSELLSTHNASLVSVPVTNTTYTTNSPLKSVIYKNLLPTTPIEPIVTIMSGLSGQDAPFQNLELNREITPEVTDPTGYHQNVKITNPAGQVRTVPMLSHNPYSLSTRSEVLCYPPLMVDTIAIRSSM